MNTPPTVLTSRFTDAMAYAVIKHGGQRRKGTEIPYVSHPIAVAGLVLEDGGTEDEAIAGLLHDVVEDCGGRPVLDEIRQRFGPTVADIVDGCTDAYETPKPDWRPRKEAYIEHFAEASESVLRVANADKLHNARSLLTDLRDHGESLWERFNASREETLWYYGEVTRVLGQRRGASRLTRELRRVVEQLG